MTTINTTDDLLTLLRENHEFREAVRQAILTEELLSLPAVFSAFASEIRSDIKRLEQGQQELRGSVNQLEEGQQELRGSVNQLEEGQQELRGSVNQLEEGQQELRTGQRELRGSVNQLEEGQQELRTGQRELRGSVNRLEEGQQELRTGQRELKSSVDALRGSSLEQKLRTKLIPMVSREFNVRRTYPIWAPGIFAIHGSSKEFDDRMVQAAESGIISEDDEDRLRVTDFIMRSQRKADRSTLWFAVEASGVIHDDDITRAKRSAEVITKLYGQTAIPLVYGYQIHEEQAKLASDLDVPVFIDTDRN